MGDSLLWLGDAGTCRCTAVSAGAGLESCQPTAARLLLGISTATGVLLSGEVNSPFSEARADLYESH